MKRSRARDEGLVSVAMSCSEGRRQEGSSNRLANKVSSFKGLLNLTPALLRLAIGRIELLL